MELNIGIAKDKRQTVGAGLSKLLAETYTLYLMTHRYHWNVTGPHFTSLHAMFEVQYTELAVAVDDIAERIRALGILAPGSYKEFAALSNIDDSQPTPDWRAMTLELVNAHETLIQSARALLAVVEDANDEVSTDVLVGRLAVHEKTAWMLRSLLQ